MPELPAPRESRRDVQPRLVWTEPPREHSDEASVYYIEQMVGDAEGDDEKLLLLLREAEAVRHRHGDRIREQRNMAAQRLRDAGWPMTKIAALAGISDSALTRQLIEQLGSARRIDRRPKPRRSR